MSQLAVRGIPLKWNAPYVRTILSRAIHGSFQILNIVPCNGPKSRSKDKIAYLQLSERLDPHRVIEEIRLMSESKPVKLTAYIPENVPKARKKKKHGVTMGGEMGNKQVLQITYREIMTEMQMKYPALNNLSKKTGHKLLDDIGRTVMERLKKISSINMNTESPSTLGSAYRKSHPHFGDFQLVVATLHRLQDKAGVPRTQLQEATLLPPKAEGEVVNNVPINKVRAACLKYSEKVIKKIQEHVDSLKTEASESDTEEDSARKRVREEFKKIGPYYPMIVRQVINRHFVPEKLSISRIRLYGEPTLPPRAALAPVLTRLGAGPASRSWRSYNMLSMKVPPHKLAAILAMDGTLISGSKLVIRPADIPVYRGGGADGWGPADDVEPDDEAEDDDEYNEEL